MIYYLYLYYTHYYYILNIKVYFLQYLDINSQSIGPVFLENVFSNENVFKKTKGFNVFY